MASSAIVQGTIIGGEQTFYTVNDETATLPNSVLLSSVTTPVAQGGTGVTAIPVMYAGRSGNQAVATATFTKVQFNNEVIDSNSNYDPTTNYRFTPTIAGTYLVCLSVTFDVSTDQMIMIPRVYKNGVAYQAIANSASGIGQNSGALSVAVAMNGSTDYIEGYCYQASGVSRNVNTNSSLSICWVGA
jgi:hypothetical protein